MTQVAFHIGIDDRVGYACRLLRKAVASGAKALVVGEPDTLAALDKALWDFEQTSFFAHARADAPAVVRDRSPVLLAEHVPADCAQEASLVNLGAQIPDDPHARSRLIELVGADEDALRLARGRWKDYGARGFSLTNHDARKR